MSVLGHRLRAYRSDTFNPLSISGLFAWFDSSDASSFTYSSGTLVSQWNDKSGNARHVSQADTGKQPSRNGTKNGLDTVTFYGNTDYLANLSPTLPAIGNVYAVLSRRNVFVAYMQIIAGPTNNWGGSIFPQLVVDKNTGLRLSTGTTTWTADQYHLATFGVSNGSQFVRYNRSTESTNTNVVTFSGAGIALGAGRPDGSFPGDGALAEVLVYDSFLSTTDRDSVELYLKAKWGTP